MLDGRSCAEAARFARAESWIALAHVAAEVRPGMTERQARELAVATLERHGAAGHWQPVAARFGAGILEIAREPSEPARVLGWDDIYSIDVGPIWGRHPGGAADTFVLGDDPEKHACADAARDLWRDVQAQWFRAQPGSEVLRAFAAQQAEARGWRLVCGPDGPAGAIACSPRPDGGPWLLKIRIAHPSRPFGALYTRTCS